VSHIKVTPDITRRRSVAVLSDAAFRLYFTAACNCAEQRVGAFLEFDELPFLPRVPRSRKKLARLVAELEASGAWKKMDSGWQLDAGTDPYGNPLWVPVLGTKNWNRDAYPAVFRRDGYSCRYCGSTDYLSIDHVVPRHQGGSDDEPNLVVACRSCNSRKGARTPEQAGMRPLPVQFETATGESTGPISSSESNEETLQ